MGANHGNHVAVAQKTKPKDGADWLADRLDALGWRQRKLAKEVGVSPSTVSRWLKRLRVPQRKTIRKLSAEPINIPPEVWI